MRKLYGTSMKSASTYTNAFELFACFDSLHKYCMLKLNKKAQLSLTNPRDVCEKFARFT